MKIAYSKNFLKQAKKLDVGLRGKAVKRMSLFAQNPLDETLNNHALKGQYKHYRSISITGDVRALYLQCGDEAIFDIIGSHSQLYG